jgi:hypothetical protein
MSSNPIRFTRICNNVNANVLTLSTLSLILLSSSMTRGFDDQFLPFVLRRVDLGY